MASPIQIILNDKDYEEKRDAGGGGPKKDFVAHRDTEFRALKKKLISQLETLSKTIASQTQGDVGYIKVILRRGRGQNHIGPQPLYSIQSEHRWSVEAISERCFSRCAPAISTPCVNRHGV